MCYIERYFFNNIFICSLKISHPVFGSYLLPSLAFFQVMFSLSLRTKTKRAQSLVCTGWPLGTRGLPWSVADQHCRHCRKLTFSFPVGVRCRELLGEGGVCTHSLPLIWGSSALSLCGSRACCLNHCELTCASALPFWRTVPLITTASGSYSLSAPFLCGSLSPEGRSVCNTDIPFRAGYPRVSCSLCWPVVGFWVPAARNFPDESWAAMSVL